MKKHWFLALIVFCLVSLLGVRMKSPYRLNMTVGVLGRFYTTGVPLPPMKNFAYSPSGGNGSMVTSWAQFMAGVPSSSTPSVTVKNAHPSRTTPTPLTKTVHNIPSKGNFLPGNADEKCYETSNFVFIKTHKTGSSTLRSLTCRFGYFRNLSFVLGVGGIIGHLNGIPVKFGRNTSNILPPIGVRQGDFSNYKNYNISNIHLLYYKTILSRIMNPADDLKFFTILREPSEQWLSSFQYFKQYVKAGLKLNTLPQTLLPYLRRLKFGQGNFNKQLRDLGVSSRVILGTPKVLNETIQRLDKDLTFVLIMEYFDESLIILKKLFCWSFEDILYVKKRQQPNPLKVSPETRKEILRHSAPDVALYNHFLGVFWRKVEEYGPTFHEDLKTFRGLLNDTWDECIGKSIAQKSHDRYMYVENYVAQNSSTFCWALVNSKFSMDIEIVRRQGRLSDKRWKYLQT